ncbi:DUF3152 domain-containing protein [Spirillospora sp. NPDC029432]|uniref:DUF3152 domain-containing protein n=1 Tax=Spirillospora sp. NPDC029432 TaxID=3154599 RepID=UPI003456885B
MHELRQRPPRVPAPPAPRRRRGLRGPWAAAGWAVLAAVSAGLVAWTVTGPSPRPDASAAGTAAAGGGAGGGAGPAARAPVVVNGRRQPPPVRVPRAATGRYAAVPGTAAPPGRHGYVVRYTVEVERGLPFSPARFAAEVHRVLNDRRGWGRGGRLRFLRVADGPVRFRVALSSPALTDRMCRPLDTRGQVSCHARGRAVLNARRWSQGAPPYRGDVAAYREYLVNHEVGHALGHGHRGCPGPGRRAPVMVQQTLSLYGCRANPWPHPGD